MQYKKTSFLRGIKLIKRKIVNKFLRKTRLMISFFLLLITSLLLLGTPFNSSSETTELNTEQKVPEITLQEFRVKNHNYCDTFNYEITGFYSKSDSSNSSAIWFYLDDDLKSQGFETVYSGRGNWMSGCCFVELTLTKADCECKIYKKQWSAEHTADSIECTTEQIICNQDGPVNFYLGH